MWCTIINCNTNRYEFKDGYKKLNWFSCETLQEENEYVKIHRINDKSYY